MFCKSLLMILCYLRECTNNKAGKEQVLFRFVLSELNMLISQPVRSGEVVLRGSLGVMEMGALGTLQNITGEVSLEVYKVVKGR